MTTIENLRKKYPIGTRVKLMQMDDKQAPPAGTEGTVTHVDDIGNIHVHWDNGSTLALIETHDSFVIMPEEFEKIEIGNVEALFTNRRVSEGEIPEGLFRYDLRESDETGRFCAIEKRVIVNHGGTVIASKQILSNDTDIIAFTDDDNDDMSPNFLGETCTLAEFIAENTK